MWYNPEYDRHNNEAARRALMGIQLGHTGFFSQPGQLGLTDGSDTGAEEEAEVPTLEEVD